VKSTNYEACHYGVFSNPLFSSVIGPDILSILSLCSSISARETVCCLGTGSAVWQQHVPTDCALTQLQEERFQHAHSSELQATLCDIWQESFDLNDDVTLVNDLSPDLGFASIFGSLFFFCTVNVVFRG